MNNTGIIYGINGPVVYLKGNTGFKMSEMVHVGEDHLVGEVIALTRDTTTVQVFEETTGLKPGAEVTATGDAISVTLGPGILSNIFDGIQRPLSEIAAQSGKYISRGVSVDSPEHAEKMECPRNRETRGRGSRRHDICRNSGDQIYPAQVHDPALAWRYDQRGGAGWVLYHSG